MSVGFQPVETWHEANQRSLRAAVARVKDALERHVNTGITPWPRDTDRSPNGSEPETSALDRLCAIFGVSPFERDILVLCAGVELDAGVAPLCAAAQGDPERAYPTFSLALAALPGAHWSALTPQAPLRYWRLIDIGPGASLTLSPLRIDERILHDLAGIAALDERLEGAVRPVSDTADVLAPAQQETAERLAAVWRRARESAGLPTLQLCGPERASRRGVAALACATIDLDVHVLDAAALPPAGPELSQFLRLWEREAALSGSALLLECDALDPMDTSRALATTQAIERLRSALIVSGVERRPDETRPLVTFDVPPPTPSEQAAAWRQALGPGSDHEQVDLLVSQFRLGLPAIKTVCAQASGTGESAHDVDQSLWDACRAQSRPRLESLSRRIASTTTWDDLVLPEPQRRILRQVAIHVRQRAKVYERWGFASRYGRGLGICLLATGPSGTGKTMAAEVLAYELRLDLYHIDLSQVVSKYIGETEKNLGRLFDAAQGGGAILLFDEADALFGKRSEVKDSHDRYANLEISYLLQRMEDFRGLVILTTNMKEALDSAFLRRIRFVIQFPFPDAAHRVEIWRRVFPAATPTEGIDPERLARLNLSGGNIRSIAMNAAFFAAEAGEPVRMAHLAAATRDEYLKLEKPLSESEVGAWA
jgi:hypothetical protein